MKVKLNSKQYDFLKEYLATERADLFEYFKKNDNLSFEINEDVAVELRDWAGEKLQKEGFDINYQPNEKGKILEEFEDLLFE